MLDITTFDDGLKEHYTDDRLQDMTYRKNPFYALVPKMEEFGGSDLPVPLIYGNPQGRSRDFAKAQARAAATSTKLKSFHLTRVKDYSLVQIDGETIEASKGNVNAFVEAQTTEIDGGINILTKSISQKLFRSGFGELGRIGSRSGSTITMLDINDIVNIEVGQKHVFSSSLDAAALRDSGDTLEVLGVNTDTGVITYTAAVSGVSGLADSDFIFNDGDREDSASPSRLCIAGLGAWVPDTAPGATLFFQVDRTSHVSRLGGLRDDFSTLPIEEALIEADSRVGREGGALTHFFMNNKKVAALKKALGTKVQYVDLMANARIGFRSIVVDGDAGPISVVADPNCPSDRCFGVDMATWKLCSLGKPVRFLNSDGLKMLRATSADAYEARIGFYGNLRCNAPGWNINFKV